MPQTVRFSQLSRPRQMLVRLCQAINHGQVRNLSVRNGEPVFDPLPVVLFDLKLGSEDGVRLETKLDDFDLRNEVCRLLRILDEMVDSEIFQVEVRDGIPRRCLFAASGNTGLRKQLSIEIHVRPQ